MSLNGLHETRWTWIHMLIHPFMHGARVKAKRNRCSVDMSHRGRRHHEFESVLWPLWMSAIDCYSIPSLTTSKCLIKLKWLKNDGDKYLRIAVLHGPMALRRLTTSQLEKTSGSTPLPRCLPCLQAARRRCASHIWHETPSFIIWHKWMKIILTDSQPTYRTMILRISRI